MSQQKVSAQEIANALLEWRGNVQAAAEALGVRRNSLYERIQRLGLKLEAFRSATRTVVPVTGVPGASGGVRSVVSGSAASGHTRGARAARKSDRARFTGDGSVPRLADMEALNEEQPEGAPIKSVSGRPRPPRLRPNQQDQLREAKLDLGARYRIETDENLILQQFFDEQFENWVEQKLAPAESNGKRKGRK